MSKAMKAVIALMVLSILGALVVATFPSRPKIPDVIKGRPTENIMDFGKYYWKNLNFEEKRAYLEGYMTGLMSATMQVTVFHDVPHDDLKHIAMIGMSSTYMVLQVDYAYEASENEERPLFQVLFKENQKARSR